MPDLQKLYAYVDESGQDTTSPFFVVVAVVSDQDRESIRQSLIDIEAAANTGQRKWHQSRPERRMCYLQRILDRGLGYGVVFFGVYTKPIPFFFPMLDLLEYAIRRKAIKPYTTRVYVDGIDQKKAAELTNALRARGITLGLVKGKRDESEPLIRLADMWAGCIRASLLGKAPERVLLDQAIATHYLERKNP